jgi:methyl-accepting chemotaxis protein
MDEVLKISETQAGPVVDKISQVSRELLQLQQDILDKGSDDNSKSVHSTLNWLIILSLLAITAGVGIAFYISRQISLPILEVARSAERIAKGDLTGDPLNITNRDEIGEMAVAFNKMSSMILPIRLICLP